MSTINNSIPFVPENTIDPAAGLNLSLKDVDALLQAAVLSIINDPPASPAEGDRHLVGTGTGVWVGKDDLIAQYLDGAWSFYAARYVVNLGDGLLYFRAASGWSAADTGGTAFTDITGSPDDNAALAAALDAKANDDDARFTDAREWTAEAVSQPEAETGTATTARKWTSLRVRQATAAWWNSITSTFGRGFVASADADAGRTALGLGSAAVRAALGTTGSLYSRDSILGAVSQTAGVPTGAIIERGSNANGSYIKYADGTMICTQKFSALLYEIASSFLGGFRGPGVTWSFPATFSAAPVVSCTSEALMGFGVGVGVPTVTGSPIFWFSVSTQGATDRLAGLLAIGRWF